MYFFWWDLKYYAVMAVVSVVGENIEIVDENSVLSIGLKIGYCFCAEKIEQKNLQVEKSWSEVPFVFLLVNMLRACPILGIGWVIKMLPRTTT